MNLKFLNFQIYIYFLYTKNNNREQNLERELRMDKNKCEKCEEPFCTRCEKCENKDDQDADVTQLEE